MTRKLLRATGAAMTLQLAGTTALAKDGVALALAAEDRAIIDRSFGQSVMGEAIPAEGLANPSGLLDLSPGPRTFRVRTEAGDESDQRYELEPIASREGRATWRYRQQGSESGFIEKLADGSFVLTGVEDNETGAVTRYSPAEPLLIAGMTPGEERRFRMQVRVFESARSNKIAHEGELEVVHRYLGAYRLRLPSGTYDAIVLKSVFHGKVGPADLDDVQYRFFSPGPGLVATIEKRDVSAFLIYNAHLNEAKWLALN